MPEKHRWEKSLYTGNGVCPGLIFSKKIPMQPLSSFSPDPAANLRMENDFLKMKLMLEQGAEFLRSPDADMPDPLTENQFLREVIEFEEKHRDAALVTIREKLGPLPDFPPADELPEGMLQSEVSRMREKLHKNGIHLATLSPNVRLRELYRFMTGEFLDLQMRDLDTPGIYCFVYDDFYPDPYYENEWMALECCIRPIIQIGGLHAFLPQGGEVLLNNQGPMDEEACRALIAAFRSRYADIVPLRCEAQKTVIREDECQVSGYHETGLCEATSCRIIRGQWKVELRRSDYGDWQVTAVTVEGIEL